MSALAEAVQWKCDSLVQKFWTPDGGGIAGLTPHEEMAIPGNLLLYGGASILWEKLIGGTGTVFSNANAYIGVGDSSTGEAATQTDLVASTNKLRKAMDSTYPTHTDGTTSGSEQIVFRSTFGTSDANFAWNEYGIFNASTAGRMLNRKVASLGTKTSAGTWVLTITLSLA